MSTEFICVTCGTQYAASETAPEGCPICLDERQFIPAAGQGWTTLARLKRTHANTFRHDGAVLGIGVAPQFAIGQRALLLRTPAGNVLWDCVSLLSDAAVEIIAALGGIDHIAISHPHYYTTMVEWSRRFGDAPIHLNANDREWVMRPDPAVRFWSGDTLEILDGVTLVRTGGHFEGGTVLHWAGAHDGKGALFTGDLIQVTADARHFAFMRSYPNFLPLGAKAVRRVAAGWRPTGSTPSTAPSGTRSSRPGRRRPSNAPSPATWTGSSATSPEDPAMRLNDPTVVAEVLAAVSAYDEALVANDLPAIDAMFLDDPGTVRYGEAENLYGARAIAAFRAARPRGPKPRTVLRTEVMTFDTDFAVANVEFRLPGDERIGRQSQTWVRIAERWRVVAAHVSYMRAR